MTPSELKALTGETAPFFFVYRTMKFFGDTMKNFGVRACTIQGRKAWELYRKHPVKHGLTCSAFFDQETFKRVSPKVGA